MNPERTQLSLPAKAALAGELKNRIKLLQATRSDRDGSRHSDAKWRAKLGKSFQTLRDTCCPHVEESNQSNGKNARRVILEESMKQIQRLEEDIIATYGPKALIDFRLRFEGFESRFSEPVASLSRSLPKRAIYPRKININQVSFNYYATNRNAPSDAIIGLPCSFPIIKSEDSSNFSEPLEPGEPTFLTNNQKTFGCSQPELDGLKALMDKTPEKGDLMDIVPVSEPIKWSSHKGDSKCRRKLDMDSVADYLECSDELKKVTEEDENVVKLSQLSGDDVLEYFENSNTETSQHCSQKSVVEPSSPLKNSRAFEFDENAVRDFLKSEGAYTQYTPSQD